MILVIADDLSGAAELAGAAVNFGLTAEVQTAFNPASLADVICLDTDSRLLPEQEAVERVAAAVHAAVLAGPTQVFKKCDSVLRGSVLAEARAVADAFGKSRLAVLPANPSRDRVIRGGHYFVAGKPLHQTAFASDPVHPRTTSEVKALLGAGAIATEFPDVETPRDLETQAAKLSPDMLPVGGVDFFTAWLERRAPNRPLSASPFALPAASTVLVCGSQTAWPARAAEAARRDLPVFSLPHDLPALVAALDSHSRVLVGIGDNAPQGTRNPRDLTRQLAASLVELIRQRSPDCLLLEGGATAAAVIAALGWTRLRTERATDDAIAVLRPVAAGKSPLLLIKPGSYAWPESIWPGEPA